MSEKGSKEFQMPIQHSDLLVQLIDHFPYPIAVFGRGGILITANRAMMKRIGIRPDDIEGRRINFLYELTTFHPEVLEAADTVFEGETALVRDVLLFPVYTEDESMPHGVAVLMK